MLRNKCATSLITENCQFSCLYLRPPLSLIKIIPQTQFSYRRGLTGMAYRSSSRDLSIV